jgi:hypothetical protein
MWFTSSRVVRFAFRHARIAARYFARDVNADWTGRFGGFAPQRLQR